MDLVKQSRRRFRKALSPSLRKHDGRKIKVFCAICGIGKTFMVCKMADAKKFPLLLAFYTRGLRDKTHAWFCQKFPGKKVLKLDSPLERLEQLYGFDTKEFLNRYLDPGTHFSKALRGYLEWVHPEEPAKVNNIVGSYNQASGKFKRDLKRFYAGEFDIVFTTQQGLLLRILHSDKFTIPDHINVVFDELEVGLWTEDETTPKTNSRARSVLAAGGRWSILTGDSSVVTG